MADKESTILSIKKLYMNYMYLPLIFSLQTLLEGLKGMSEISHFLEEFAHVQMCSKGRLYTRCTVELYKPFLSARRASRKGKGGGGGHMDTSQKKQDT